MPEGRDGKVDENLRCPNCMKKGTVRTTNNIYFQCFGSDGEILTPVRGMLPGSVDRVVKVKTVNGDGCGFIGERKDFWEETTQQKLMGATQ